MCATPHGPISIQWKRDPEFTLSVALPPGVSARLDLPASGDSSGVILAGHRIEATRVGSRWILADPVKGQLTLEGH